MSTSFPYLTLSRRLGVRYGAILAAADYLDEKYGHQTIAEMVERDLCPSIIMFTAGAEPSWLWEVPRDARFGEIIQTWMNEHRRKHGKDPLKCC